jgi:hypothetical protein
MMSAHNLLARQLPDGRESKVDPSAPAKQAIDHSDFCDVPGIKAGSGAERSQILRNASKKQLYTETLKARGDCLYYQLDLHSG